MKNYAFNLMLVLISLIVTTNVYSEPVSDKALVKAALKRTHASVIYNGAYRKIEYPMGDVPANIGVCTDVVIRSYRQIGIDLQEFVHEDMSAAFEQYPNHWGLKRPDTNIDHRRVPNLEAFFKRHGQVLRVSQNSIDYQPGDIVSWRLDNNLPHIGIVSNIKDPSSGNFKIVHNIGLGPKLDDMLFDYKIVGHFRYFPQMKN